MVIVLGLEPFHLRRISFYVFDLFKKSLKDDPCNFWIHATATVFTVIFWLLELGLIAKDNTVICAWIHNQYHITFESTIRFSTLVKISWCIHLFRSYINICHSIAVLMIIANISSMWLDFLHGTRFGYRCCYGSMISTCTAKIGSTSNVIEPPNYFRSKDVSIGRTRYLKYREQQLDRAHEQSDRKYLQLQLYAMHISSIVGFALCKRMPIFSRTLFVGRV